MTIGRVKLFRLGFLVFTVGSILLYLAPGTGEEGALELIVFRPIQAEGGAFTMANGAAILSTMRGERYVHEIHGPGNGVKAAAVIPEERKK